MLDMDKMIECLNMMDDVVRLIDRLPKRVPSAPASASTNWNSIEGFFLNKEMISGHCNDKYIDEQDEKTHDNVFNDQDSAGGDEDDGCIFDILKFLKLISFLNLLLDQLQSGRDDTKKNGFCF